jgi:beta-lactam-binding protein with PASTA domain
VKALFKLALLGLVLLVVALVSALTAMRFAIHGREVSVPQLVGMSPFDAERTAIASGLQLDVERQYYSANVPEGRIMSQMPGAGIKVRRGWQIRVAQSLGPQRIAIPDVTGQTARAAELNIGRRGLDLGTIATVAVPNIPPDQVIAQSPPANARGVAAPHISLLLAAAPEGQSFVMPNLVGQALGSATAILQGAGMKVGNVKVSSMVEPGPDSGAAAPPPPAALPSSLILSHKPAAGEKIAVGTLVDIDVSR